MRKINVKEVTSIIRDLCIESNCSLGKDVTSALKEYLKSEISSEGIEVISQIIENIELAENYKIPLCQDTGFAVVFIEIGQEVVFSGGDLNGAINEGISKGYTEGFLRKSMVNDPVWDRINTTDNTPGMIHYDIVKGDKVKITMVPKGGGAENMAALKMLSPSDGKSGIVDFVVNQTINAGPNPCPPTIVGIGIGGNFEKVAILAKKALLRNPIGTPNIDKKYAELEDEILCKINSLGIGPQGYGGRTTALAVHIEYLPTHIGCMPIAINYNCHAARHKQYIL